MTQAYSKFSTKKDAEKCFRLLKILGDITFTGKNYGMGIEPKKNMVWIRK